ncbi:MAG: hypothetical protein LBT62_07220 [Deltaproteobacteria bacterium]|nr:hypothetical protein [Deltaproteobacteria bacterium]
MHRFILALIVASIICVSQAGPKLKPEPKLKPRPKLKPGPSSTCAADKSPFPPI